MLTRNFAALAVLLFSLSLAACGGSDSPSAALNSAFNGSWVGTSTLTAQGYAPLTYQGQTSVAVSVSTATLSNICPGGGSSITATGSGNTASWTGSVVCPAVNVVGFCSSVVFTATSATMSLSQDGATLTAQASGQGVGCGGTLAVTLSFVGQK